MDLVSFKDKALQRFWRTGSTRGLSVTETEKLRRMLSFLASIDDVSEFLRLPRGRPHRLVGEREGTFSVSITANWRLTFIVIDDAVHDLSLEDYH